MRRNFNLRLEQALSDIVNLVETAPNPAAGGGKAGPDPTQQDPKLKQQQKDSERQGQNAAGATGAPQAGTTAAGGGAAPADPKAAAQNQKAQADKQKQQTQGTQLSTRMADFDKQIAQLQAKISGGAAKPAEIGKLNQLLTAKKSIQDQFMRTYGVNPTA